MRALWQRNVEIQSLSYKLHDNSVFLNHMLVMHARWLHTVDALSSEVVIT